MVIEEFKKFYFIVFFVNRNFGLLSFGNEAEEDEEMLEDITEVNFY